MERIFEHKNKEGRLPKFSEKDLFDRIKLRYTSFDPSLISEEGEMLNGDISVSHEPALEKIGDMCVYYQDSVAEAKRIIRDYVSMAGLAVNMMVEGVFMRTVSSEMIGIAGLAACVFIAFRSAKRDDRMNVYQIHGLYHIENIKDNIKTSLSVFLSKDYIDKYFPRIVKTFAKRQRPINAENTRIRLEEEKEKELAVRSEELGLPKKDEIDLDTFVQEREKSIKTTSQKK